ncbi:putative squalene synthase, partial [Lachnellula willkommii]
MVKINDLLYLSVHPNQLRSIIQWKLWHDPVHSRDPDKETENLKQCFYYLNMTSRSFSSVIQELNPELLVPVAIFYLCLRGLDTIEDDMTIPLQKKEPLLRDFDKILFKDGWNFNGNGPDEKDRELLVHFDVVVTEFKLIKPAYQKIILDITKKMGNGMADYANNAEFNENGVDTIKDYELYCHYVAGLRPELSESMGQFLQKTNIIRDLQEDFHDKRRFYPKEIWSKHVTNFEDLFDPRNVKAALNCTSEMVLNAIQKADECLFYMAGIKDQSVFNFVAIPQVMAIATLELVFQNPKVFTGVVKITKGDACQLMVESSQNLRTVCEVFKRYARRISKKNNPADPNFLEISIACGKIEQFIESIYPTQDPKALTRQYDNKEEVIGPADAKLLAEHEEAKKDVFYLLIAVMCTLAVISTTMIGIAWLAGARFDIAFNELRNGNFFPKYQSGGEVAETIVQQHDHGE